MTDLITNPPPTAGQPTLLRDVAQAVVPVLALMGVVVYGLLIFGYSEFYRELGIRPEDVGISYGGSLGGAAGLTILIICTALVVGAGILGLRRAVSSSGPRRRTLLPLIRTAGVILTLAGGLVGVFVFTYLADVQADLVKHGQWLEPVRVANLEILSVRADPVEMLPIDESPLALEIADRTDGHDLYYLGESGGIAVVYDATDQSVWRVSLNQMVLRTENCETTLTDSARCGPEDD